ncbi:hypothetical protein CCHR01_07058 [Colletotrichum chrysophilum]|uniref:Uncharacterized protein n=1 Tax=Colletotrichum chrysophilum TaxID=1836956 RepID=A0AAD9EG90_9PEZI|nr:hypothetical protein CCHR01_07058 [Colletotrichum chrysophilum]
MPRSRATFGNSRSMTSASDVPETEKRITCDASGRNATPKGTANATRNSINEGTDWSDRCRKQVHMTRLAPKPVDNTGIAGGYLAAPAKERPQPPDAHQRGAKAGGTRPPLRKQQLATDRGMVQQVSPHSLPRDQRFHAAERRKDCGGHGVPLHGGHCACIRHGAMYSPASYGCGGTSPAADAMRELHWNWVRLCPLLGPEVQHP